MTLDQGVCCLWLVEKKRIRKRECESRAGLRARRAWSALWPTLLEQSYFIGMDSIIFLNQTGFTGLSGCFCCLHQFPEEIDETQSTFGGKNRFRFTNMFISKFGAKTFWLAYRNPILPRRRRLGILCFLREQRIKNPINSVNPVQKEDK